MACKAATVTLSDSCVRGGRADESGVLLQDLLRETGAEIVRHYVLPDDLGKITELLLELSMKVDVVITTGGTGISPRDVTPEATASIVEKRLPGVEAALHLAGRERAPTAILSRGIVGTRGKCLIANLPGSPGAVRDGMQVLSPVLQHAVHLLRGEMRDCAHGWSD